MQRNAEKQLRRARGYKSMKVFKARSGSLCPPVTSVLQGRCKLEQTIVLFCVCARRQCSDAEYAYGEDNRNVCLHTQAGVCIDSFDFSLKMKIFSGYPHCHGLTQCEISFDFLATAFALDFFAFYIYNFAMRHHTDSFFLRHYFAMK